MSDLSHEELEKVRRYLAREERKESGGDMFSDAFFDEVYDRPHMIVALATLAPKGGGSWAEERLLLWLEVVEKTARLVYGLDSEWSSIVGAESPTEKARANADADEAERLADLAEANRAQAAATLPAHAEGQAGASDSSTSVEDKKSEATRSPTFEPVLAALEGGPLRLMELADRSGVSKGSIGTTVDALERKGLVESERSGRARLVGLVAALAPEPEPAEKAKPPRRENLEAEVLEVLNASYHVALRRNEIAERLDANPDSVTDVLARLVATNRVEKCAAGSATSYRVPARPRVVESKSCRAKDCILAAVPGTDLCDRHADLAERIEQATA